MPSISGFIFLFISQGNPQENKIGTTQLVIGQHWGHPVGPVLSTNQKFYGL